MYYLMVRLVDKCISFCRCFQCLFVICRVRKPRPNDIRAGRALCSSGYICVFRLASPKDTSEIIQHNSCLYLHGEMKEHSRSYTIEFQRSMSARETSSFDIVKTV